MDTQVKYTVVSVETMEVWGWGGRFLLVFFLVVLEGSWSIFSRLVLCVSLGIFDTIESCYFCISPLLEGFKGLYQLLLHRAVGILLLFVFAEKDFLASFFFHSR